MKEEKRNLAPNEKTREEGNEMAWQVLSREYLIRKQWLTARCDKVCLPTGAVVDEYYVLEYPEWVNTVAITREGDFVLVRQYRYALGVTAMEICAGVMEQGEEPMQAAQRELLEETGFGNGTWRPLMTIAPNPGTMTNRCHCFLATDVEKVSGQHLDDTEDIQVHVVSRDEMLRMLKNNELYQAMMYAPLWKYFALEDELKG